MSEVIDSTAISQENSEPSRGETSGIVSDMPLEFAPPEHSIWESYEYKPDHLARRYLDSLLSTPLDYDEKIALERYSENEGSSDINRSLTEGHPNHNVKLIDSAMAKVRLPQTTIVFRGDSHEKANPDDVKAGTTFERIGYTSTTLDRSLARGWHNSLTVLKIEVPAGTPVAVPQIKEAEILLPHGSSFEIIGATEKNDYTEVYVRLVPPA